jgi:hypothetical protein
MPGLANSSISSGDAAGGGERVGGGGAEAAEPGEAGALHQAFFIGVGEEEGAAEGFEVFDHFFGGVAEDFGPAFHGAAPAF